MSEKNIGDISKETQIRNLARQFALITGKIYSRGGGKKLFGKTPYQIYLESIINDPDFLYLYKSIKGDVKKSDIDSLLSSGNPRIFSARLKNIVSDGDHILENAYKDEYLKYAPTFTDLKTSIGDKTDLSEAIHVILAPLSTGLTDDDIEHSIDNMIETGEYGIERNYDDGSGYGSVKKYSDYHIPLYSMLKNSYKINTVYSSYFPRI